jgi:hypothetical protein
MKKILFVFLLKTSFSACQLPPDSALFAQLAGYYEIRAKALKIEYSEEKRKSWWELAPTVGTAYAADGKPRLGVSFNFARIIDFVFARKRERRQFAAARLSLFSQYAADSMRLSAAIMDYQNAAQPTPFADSIAIIERQFFEIAVGQFSRLEISPQAFLTAKRAYFQTFEATEQKRRELAEKAFRVLALSAGSL